MFSRLKRPLEDHETDPNAKKKPFSQSLLDYVRWKIWLLRNYDFEIGSSTAISSIFNLSSAGTYSQTSVDKDTFPCKLHADALGGLVKEIWQGKVKRVKRGARGKQESHYLNLARKTVDRAASSLSIHSESYSILRDCDVPSNWRMIRNNDDSFSFIRLENFEANNHRAMTEVTVVVLNNKVESITVRANGNSVSLSVDKLDISNDISCLKLRDQIQQIIVFVDNLRICQGYHLPTEEKVMAISPHHLQYVKDLTQSAEPEKIAYSDNCLVILTYAQKRGQCGNCAVLKKTDLARKKRKLSQLTLHPNCNKRYLEKDEIEKQLQRARLEKKKAIKREEYWKEKFQEEATEQETDDH